MTLLSKVTLRGAAAALAAGLSFSAMSSSMAADLYASMHSRDHLRYAGKTPAPSVGPYYSPHIYAYGDGPRHSTDYYFTSSSFCMPDSHNAYNGGFATLAYDANGRAVGYVCR